MRIAIGSDHAGFEQKEQLREHLAREGHDVDALALVPTPEDIVDLRRRDPAAVARWRRSTRDALLDALGAGHRVVGFTRDGNYVIG